MESAIASVISKGTPSGWTLCVLGLVGVILLAKIALNQRPQMKELEMSEGASLRTAFVAEMTALRGEITELRDENNALRREIRELHAVIDGMRRENLTAHLSGQRVVAEALAHSPEIERAIDSLKNVKGAGE